MKNFPGKREMNKKEQANKQDIGIGCQILIKHWGHV